MRLTGELVRHREALEDICLNVRPRLLSDGKVTVQGVTRIRRAYVDYAAADNRLDRLFRRSRDEDARVAGARVNRDVKAAVLASALQEELLEDPEWTEPWDDTPKQASVAVI